VGGILALNDWKTLFNQKVRWASKTNSIKVLMEKW
jgi:hypothetical protein